MIEEIRLGLIGFLLPSALADGLNKLLQKQAFPIGIPSESHIKVCKY